MGYRGYQEIICSSGHYEGRRESGYEDIDPRTAPCSICKSKVAFRHAVNVTNGYEEDNTYLNCDAPKVEIGFTDEWKVDHYGNTYAVKHRIYVPDPKKKRVWQEGE